jgi:hypothetical protein
MSFLKPTQILIADGVRDGGSYFVMYEATDGQRYSLFAQVRLDGKMKAIGYELPRISCQATAFARDLTWAEAQEVGSALGSLQQERIPEGNVERLRECLGLLSREGKPEGAV